jgi:hypothetical protein
MKKPAFWEAGRWYLVLYYLHYHPPPWIAGIIITTTTVAVEVSRVITLFKLRWAMKDVFLPRIYSRQLNKQRTFFEL